MKLLARQKIKEIARNPENEALYDETYGEMLDDLAKQIDSLESQIGLLAEKQSAVVRVNRTAKTAIDIFSDIIEKDGACLLAYFGSGRRKRSGDYARG